MAAAEGAQSPAKLDGTIESLDPTPDKVDAPLEFIMLCRCARKGGDGRLLGARGDEKTSGFYRVPSVCFSVCICVCAAASFCFNGSESWLQVVALPVIDEKGHTKQNAQKKAATVVLLQVEKTFSFPFGLSLLSLHRPSREM